MGYLRGFARNPGARSMEPWAIVDRDQQFLIWFDHGTFPLILDGAPVVYTVGSGGFADDVQPATELDRYVDRFVARTGREALARTNVEHTLIELVMTVLLEAKHLEGDARDKALRRLRDKIDRLEF